MPPLKDVATDRSVLSMTALICGIAAWVPLLILAAAPISLGSAAIAYVTVRGPDRSRRLAPARWGVVLTLIAIVLHGAIFLLAAGVSRIAVW